MKGDVITYDDLRLQELEYLRSTLAAVREEVLRFAATGYLYYTPQEVRDDIVARIRKAMGELP